MKKHHGSSSKDSGRTRQITIPTYDHLYDDVYNLVFCNFSALARKAERSNFSPKNGEAARFDHIDFVLKSCANLSSKLFCPHCHKATIKSFRIKDGRLVPCCGNPRCRSGCPSDELYPLSFNVFTAPAFSSSTDMQKQLKHLLREALGLPENPAPDRVYVALKKNYEVSCLTSG